MKLNGKILMSAALVAAGAVGWCLWSQRASSEGRDKAGAGLKAAQHTKVDDARETAKTPAAEAPANMDPAELMDELTQKYAGSDLNHHIYTAGHQAGQRGLEEAKKFILADPPGSVGRTALTGVVHGLSPEFAGDMFQFLRQSSGNLLPARFATDGITNLIDRWGFADSKGAQDFFMKAPLSHEEKLKYLKDVYGAMRADAGTVKDIREVADPALRAELIASSSYIRASIESGSFEVFSELQGTDIKDGQRSSLLNALEHSKNVDKALDALLASRLPSRGSLASDGISQWVVRDMNAALSYLDKQSDKQVIDSVVRKSWKVISEYDREAALAWINRVSDEGARASMTAEWEKMK